MSESMPTNETSDSETSQVAREQGRQLKDSARNAASDVVGTATDRVGGLRDEAATRARGIAGDVQREVRGRADQEARRAGSALSQAGSQLQALAEGRVDEAGAFGEYAQQAARALNGWADTVQDRGLDGMLDDLRSVARRRPGAFLLGALAAGVVAGRFGRNLRGEISDQETTDGRSDAPSRASRPTTPPPSEPPRDHVSVGGRQAADPPADAQRRSTP